MATVNFSAGHSCEASQNWTAHKTSLPLLNAVWEGMAKGSVVERALIDPRFKRVSREIPGFSLLMTGVAGAGTGVTGLSPPVGAQAGTAVRSGLTIALRMATVLANLKSVR